VTKVFPPAVVQKTFFKRKGGRPPKRGQANPHLKKGGVKECHTSKRGEKETVRGLKMRGRILHPFGREIQQHLFKRGSVKNPDAFLGGGASFGAFYRVGMEEQHGLFGKLRTGV